LIEQRQAWDAEQEGCKGCEVPGRADEVGFSVQSALPRAETPAIN